jgi:hypothetical protein
VIRFNKPIDGIGFHQRTPDDWKPSPSGDDVAITSVKVHFDAIRFSMISPTMFATPKDLEADEEADERAAIGTGDECFMLGRYVDADGRARGNRPVVRFGNLARTTPELIARDDGVLQESLLVEMRSLSGFSGSAVFIYDDGQEFHLGQGNEQKLLTTARKPYLLGIDWCHLPWQGDVSRGFPWKAIPTEYWSSQNSGMAGVVPAWRIAELLEDQELQDERRETEEAELKKDPPAAGKADSRRKPKSKADDDGVTRDEFIRDLRKVTKPGGLHDSQHDGDEGALT